MDSEENHLSVENVAQLGLAELRKRYGHHKIFLPEFELPALIALSRYPELAEIRIEFIAIKSNTPCGTRPSRMSFFRSAKRRQYIISITTKIDKGREEILPGNLPLELQVGLIAHELGHVCDFMRKSSFEVFVTALLYGLKSYKRKLEKKVDAVAVIHGFGQQLLDYVTRIIELRRKYPDDRYYSTYFDYYMTGEEIRRLMKSEPRKG